MDEAHAKEWAATSPYYGRWWRTGGHGALFDVQSGLISVDGVVDPSVVRISRRGEVIQVRFPSISEELTFR